jgi:hypothetical protein
MLAVGRRIEALLSAVAAAGCDAGYYFNRSNAAAPSCSPCEPGFICQPARHYVQPAARTVFDRKSCAAYGPGLTTKRSMSTSTAQCGEPAAELSSSGNSACAYQLHEMHLFLLQQHCCW